MSPTLRNLLRYRLLLISIAVMLGGPLVYWTFSRSEESFTRKIDASFAIGIFIAGAILTLYQAYKLRSLRTPKS